MATKFAPVSSVPLPPSVFPPVFAGHYRYYPRFGRRTQCCIVDAYLTKPIKFEALCVVVVDDVAGIRRRRDDKAA